jgi:hypothetical protein
MVFACQLLAADVFTVHFPLLSLFEQRLAFIKTGEHYILDLNQLKVPAQQQFPSLSHLKKD